MCLFGLVERSKKTHVRGVLLAVGKNHIGAGVFSSVWARNKHTLVREGLGPSVTFCEVEFTCVFLVLAETGKKTHVRGVILVRARKKQKQTIQQATKQYNKHQLINQANIKRKKQTIKQLSKR